MKYKYSRYGWLLSTLLGMTLFPYADSHAADESKRNRTTSSIYDKQPSRSSQDLLSPDRLSTSWAELAQEVDSVKVPKYDGWATARYQRWPVWEGTLLFRQDCQALDPKTRWLLSWYRDGNPIPLICGTWEGDHRDLVRARRDGDHRVEVVQRNIYHQIIYRMGINDAKNNNESNMDRLSISYR